MFERVAPVEREIVVGLARLERASAIARSMQYLELSARPDFQDLFVDGMCFE